MKKLFLTCLMGLTAFTVNAQPSWPSTSVETKAGTRWWWMGSAVDDANLSSNLAALAAAGIGTVEVTPIYGVQGNDANNISYLSNKWMSAFQQTLNYAAANGMQVDMNNGTGWPFGGPKVTIADAAGKLVTDTLRITGDGTTAITRSITASTATTQLNKIMAFPQGDNTGAVTEITDKASGATLTWTAPAGQWLVILIYNGHTLQAVKRAAPGGDGYVLDHLNADAVKRYLERFDTTFTNTGTAWPATLFNDSWELSGADWTPSFLEEFEARRGYKLEENIDKLLGYTKDATNQVMADYRETLNDLVIDNFLGTWREWAHTKGAKVRNQAHGSPGNLIDIYAAADIPEIEGFGLSNFGIKGLRDDGGFTSKNYSDLFVLKLASSAAHVTGKNLSSSESMTWLTEHFRTSLSQMKPDIDLLFTAGVNRLFFHGTTYSPAEAAWPGWKFYASIDMSPTNSIWRDAPEMLTYIDRCQSFLQMGTPDNDFIVYAPFYDAWHKTTGSSFSNRLLRFEISDIGTKLSTMRTAVNNAISAGFDCDYISDRMLLETTYSDGMIATTGGAKYKGLIVPEYKYMPEKVKAHLDSLQTLGAKIVYATDAATISSFSDATAEEMRTELGLSVIRRANDTGHHYFIANLTPYDKEGWVSLATAFQSAAIFNPMDGTIINALTNDGKMYVSLRSGESMILQTYDSATEADDTYKLTTPMTGKDITTGWTLAFTDSYPENTTTYTIDSLKTWENLDDITAQLAGTGVYQATFNVDDATVAKATGGFRIDLGDVRESAKLWINDNYIGCAWSVPFAFDIADGIIKSGDNTIKVEVTNLPANRIRQKDINGEEWRIFNDVNILDVKDGSLSVSGVTSYADWEKVPSGLNSAVTVIPLYLGETSPYNIVRMQQSSENDTIYYPVYIVDGTETIDSTTAYTLATVYDFTAEEGMAQGLNKQTSRLMHGFTGKYNGAQAKLMGSDVELYDGLAFTSPSKSNSYYFFPGYGMNLLNNSTASLTLPAGYIAQLTSMQGDSENTTAYDTANALYECQQTYDDRNITFPMYSRTSNTVYVSITTFKPLDTESSGIKSVKVSAEKTEYYNLQGQRIANPTEKGIYISSGRKIVK